MTCENVSFLIKTSELIVYFNADMINIFIYSTDLLYQYYNIQYYIFVWETFSFPEWLITGDVGYIDGDGELYIVDRLKDLIKYRGYQISPAEIEDLLYTHPGVMEAAVFGVPHSIDDEHPVAFVSIKPGFTVYLSLKFLSISEINNRFSVFSLYVIIFCRSMHRLEKKQLLRMRYSRLKNTNIFTK